MARGGGGPQRTTWRAYLRLTRGLGALAVLVFAGVIASDAVDDRFWSRHALLAGVTSSAIVVMLSVAVVNEALARRSRRRWSVLAQHVMAELVRNARMTWTGLLELTGAMPSDVAAPEWLEAGAAIVRDTPRLTAIMARVAADPHARHPLHEGIARLAAHTDETIGRWAAVMLNVDLYAEIVDRHVELASQLMWVASVLDAEEPPEDVHRQHRARSSVAAQFHEPSAGWLTERLVSIVQLAEELDRTTLQVALRIVPVEWWESRLGATASPAIRVAVADSGA